ncbi:hypothetical protein D3C75_652610 [compost metagenome]
MKHPGQTARSIRLSKGFSQKEIYTGIVSKSYAISFEQGNALLNYQDLTVNSAVNWRSYTIFTGTINPTTTRLSPTYHGLFCIPFPPAPPSPPFPARQTSSIS